MRILVRVLGAITLLLTIPAYAFLRNWVTTLQASWGASIGGIWVCLLIAMLCNAVGMIVLSRTQQGGDK